jgi:putative Mn2+ efflux pump MntP
MTMSSSIVLFGLLLGLDSLVVSVGLGAALPDRNCRRGLALSFALCDGIASWLGSMTWMDGVRQRLESYSWLGPAAVAVYAAVVLWVALRFRRQVRSTGLARWVTWMLPICFSLDNLAAGAAGGASAAAALTAVALGTISGAMSLAGGNLGVALTRRAPSTLRIEWLGGAVLVATAVVLFSMELLT